MASSDSIRKYSSSDAIPIAGAEHHSWVMDFLRATVMDPHRGGTIGQWAQALVDAMADSKPDHEVHILGTSRTPRVPNYLLASSTESHLRRTGPVQIAMTKQTADLFLAPAAGGVRIFQGELPMSMSYSVEEHGAPPRRQEITFYDAVAFDAKETTIVLALVLTESTVTEFFPAEELAELQAIARAHAVPMLELLQTRALKARLEEELDGMLQVVRESNPQLGKITVALGNTPLAQRTPEPAIKAPPFELPFVLYFMQEIRSALLSAHSSAEALLEFAGSGMVNPIVADKSRAIQSSSNSTFAVVKNVSNLISLANPEVRLRRVATSLQSLLRDLFPIASEIALQYDAKAKLDERTRNIYVGVDPDSVIKMFERLLDFQLSFAQGGQVFIRSDDNPDRAGKGMAIVEIEDTGEFPQDIPPQQLLDRNLMSAIAQHPRLRRGGGVLYQMFVAYFEKMGGNFRFGRGENGGFTSQIYLPLMSRTEAERARGGTEGAKAGI